MRLVLLAALATYAVMSVVTFVAYALDKRAAQSGARRTPEKVLHLLELAFGWPGGLLAQRLVHHKSRKRSYQLVFWLIVAMHTLTWAIVAWLIIRG
ncbi:MAG: DUF1294 domain-containing protein [Phycisphaerales bacterium]